jgi:hypothetical protein
MAEQFEPQSPMWWLDRLGRQLLKRGELIRKYEAYYAGEHTQRFMTDRFREAFGGLFRNFSDNWCELVVDACEERLKVEGFRFGDDPKADVDAWQLWQANYLDADSKIGHTEALKNGIDYTWIEPGEPPQGRRRVEDVAGRRRASPRRGPHPRRNVHVGVGPAGERHRQAVAHSHEVSG